MREPNVIINLTTKKGTSRMMRGLALKMKKRTSASFMKQVKQGNFKTCTLEVHYGRDKGEQVTNKMFIQNWSDLRWAMEAFLDKSLWL